MRVTTLAMHVAVAYLTLCIFCLCSTDAECRSGNHEGLDPAMLSLIKSKENAQNLSTLINNVLKNYDRKVRPNAGGKAVMVFLEFKIISFGEIREANMEYSFDIFLRQTWYDPRFENNFSEPFTMAADPTKMFWTPDTYFWNVKKSSYHHVTRENMRVMIWPDGKIYFSARITLTAQCDMDLRLYPMDTQHCPLRIESYAYTTNDVNYTWKGGSSKGIEIVSSEMAQFDLTNVQTATKSQTNSKGSFARLTATFSFRRRTESFVSSIYVPAVVLVVLSWCCFFMNPEAVPARVGLSITTILTSILLQGSVNSNMPKVSYMKAVDYFLLTSFGFIFAALLEYILVLNSDPEFDAKVFLNRKKSKEMNLSVDNAEGSANVDIVLRVMDEGTCRIRNKKGNYTVQRESPKITARRVRVVKKVHWIDKISRFIFPFLYVIFIICYTTYYMSQRE